MKTFITAAFFYSSISLFVALLNAVTNDGPFMASGIKIGEVDQTSAIIWARLTENENYRLDGREWDEDDEALPAGLSIGDMQYSVAGSEGDVRISYWPTLSPAKAARLQWLSLIHISEPTRPY